MIQLVVNKEVREAVQNPRSIVLVAAWKVVTLTLGKPPAMVT